MAVTLIAKNQTAGALALTQLSVPNNEVPAGVGATVTLTDYATVNEIQDDVELIAHITAGDVIINDGTTDLTQIESLAIVQTTAGPTPGGIPEDLAITSLSASNFVSASVYYGDGSNLTGVSSNPAGSNTEIQFNADGAFGADPQFTWASGSNTLTVTGDISGSGNISGSAFYGDGANLTNLPPAAISTYSTPGAQRVITSVSATEVQGEANLSFDGTTLTITGSVSGSGNISGSDFYGAGANLTALSADNISAGTLNNARLPATISVTSVTASLLVSASAFYGDGSNLTNLPAGSPAGSNTQIQYNADGAFGSDADFTWASGSNTLAVTGDISASINISGSDFYGGGANLTDLNASNISAGTLDNARLPTTISVTNVTASTLVSASNFYGDGSNLTGIAAGSDTQIQFNEAGKFAADTEFTWDKLNNILTLGGVSGSGNISGSDFYGGGANLTDLNASNISAGTLDNARLPTTISVTNVTASALVSASFLYGDGSNLTNLPAGGSPGGLDTQIQFNDGGVFNGDAEFTWNKTTDTLTVTGDISGSGNISGSFFYGDGSNLTNVSATIPSGTISRVDATGAETFYLSISGAVAASTTGDYVRVGPGTYVEDTPIVIPAGISVTGEAGWQVTNVSSSTGTGDVFQLADGSLLKDFKIAIPADTGSYAVSFSGSAPSQVASANFLSFYGGTGLRGSGYGNIGRGKTIALEIRYSTGECDAILDVQDGILAVEGVHVPNSAGAVDCAVRAYSPASPRVGNRGRFQGIDINMGATNVEDGFCIGGSAVVVLQGVNLFNIQNTFHLTSNSASLLVTSGLSDPAVNDLKVDAGLTGDNAITRMMAFMDGKFDIPTTWIPSDHAWSFFTEGAGEEKATQQLWGADQIIGHPEFGSGFSAGEGANYAKNNTILTTDGTLDSPTNDGTGFIDVSASGSSAEDSTFSFQGVTAGHSILWCTNRKDSSDTTLKHWGLEVYQTTAAVLGGLLGAKFILEYQSADDEWTEIGVMAVSSEEQYRYANNIFLRADSTERLYAGISDEDTWAPTEINGTTGRRMRIRINNTISTAPVFERFKLMPSHTEVNKRGQKFASGLAQWNKTVSKGGLRWSGTMLGNTNLTIGTGTTFVQDLDTSYFNDNDDYANTQFLIPPGICTAFPIKIKFFYTFRGTGGGDNDLDISHYVAQVQGNLIADPAGALVPIVRTTANTDDFQTNAAVTDAQVTEGGTVNLKIFSIEKDTPADVSEFYEGDMVFIHFALNGSPGEEIVLLGMQLTGVAFTEGSPHD